MYFVFGREELTADSLALFDRIRAELATRPAPELVVTGHTDRVGAVAYNDALSQRRAQAVASYLTSRGVSSNRLMTVGGGERYPVASNDTDAGRAQNRRVEISVMPVRG